MPETTTNAAAPSPDDKALEEWCKLYCPSLPVRMAATVAEWNLKDKSQEHVVKILLQHVRQSVTST